MESGIRAVLVGLGTVGARRVGDRRCASGWGPSVRDARDAVLPVKPVVAVGDCRLVMGLSGGDASELGSPGYRIG